jgi:hypothetical protein
MISEWKRIPVYCDVSDFGTAHRYVLAELIRVLANTRVRFHPEVSIPKRDGLYIPTLDRSFYFVE